MPTKRRAVARKTAIFAADLFWRKICRRRKMQREDYLIRQTRELAKFLALLSGLAKKGDTEQVVKILDRTLQSNFDLDFSRPITAEMMHRFSAEELKGLVALLKQKITFKPETTGFLEKTIQAAECLAAEKNEVFDLFAR